MPVTPVLDWRQLRRWGIDEARVPAGARIQFREPTTWERYRIYILGAAMVLLDLDGRIPEDDLVALEQQVANDPAVLTLRIALARALNDDGAGPLRGVIARLDEGHLVADAARAAALLALRTKDPTDRADAERRLFALGDRAYLQRLAEDW